MIALMSEAALYDVRDVLAVQPHRDLGDAIVPRFARGLRVHFDGLDLPRRKHAIELDLQKIARLAVQHLEHLPPQRVFARHTLRAGLALAVPGADAVAPIDHVETDRKRVDDARREVAL